MSSHTPGPWEALPPETSHGHYRVLRQGTAGVNEHRVALSCCEADAHLIAVAPDLLELLEEWFEPYREDFDHGLIGGSPITDALISKVKAAITKARGEV